MNRKDRSMCFHNLRVALGITLSQASKITETRPKVLSNMETGSAEPDFSLYAKLPFPPSMFDMSGDFILDASKRMKRDGQTD